MQTTGARLLGVQQCSLARVRPIALDRHSVHRLLYLTAVWGPASDTAIKSALSLVLSQLLFTILIQESWQL
jgi:hypothetical protein